MVKQSSDKHEDRRVRYTKTLLKEALVELLQVEHISRISVKRLCEKADVNRSTFYAHYTDQYDLLNSVEKEVFDAVKVYISEPSYESDIPITVQSLSRILSYAQKNVETIRALLSENSTLTFQRSIMQLVDLITVPVDASIDPRTRQYMSIFGIDGCISVIKLWLKDDMPESPEELSELILGFLYGGPLPAAKGNSQ